MRYCINNPNRNSEEVSRSTHEKINHYGDNWVNENFDKDLYKKFNQARIDISTYYIYQLMDWIHCCLLLHFYFNFQI